MAGAPAAEISSRCDYRRLNLVGESPAFRELLHLIEQVAACDEKVLIQGETGTGKEVVARAIHYLGRRRDAPFIAVNCGAIPDSLIESELFGHCRGAFTDAKWDQAGIVAQAANGTLFLDEIEAMDVRAQVALLRFLDDMVYKPVGATRSARADVRVIASTNVELSALVSRGRFRQDLVYRLSVLPVIIPPLRYRSGDALLLAETFLRRLNAANTDVAKHLHPTAAAVLESHHWPGNVRELENLIHRKFLLVGGETIEFTERDLLSPTSWATHSNAEVTTELFRVAKARTIADFEKLYIATLLARTRGNLSLASRLSGKDRSDLGRLLKKHRLERGSFAAEPRD
jgi:DNA-binding NtrC family response regulator